MRQSISSTCTTAMSTSGPPARGATPRRNSFYRQCSWAVSLPLSFGPRVTPGCAGVYLRAPCASWRSSASPAHASSSQETRRSPHQMTHSKVRSQLLGKRPGSAPLCEVYHTRVANPDKPTLVRAIALEVTLVMTTCSIVRHLQRVPAKPPTAHGPLLLVGYGTTPLGVGSCGLAARTRRPQPRLGLGLGVYFRVRL